MMFLRLHKVFLSRKFLATVPCEYMCRLWCPVPGAGRGQDGALGAVVAPRAVVTLLPARVACTVRVGARMAWVECGGGRAWKS